MSRVGGVYGAAMARPGVRTARADGRFNDTLDAAGSTGEARAPAAAAATGSTSMLLSLQEFPDTAARDRRTRDRAQAGLASLRALQLALLRGGLARDELAALAEAAALVAETDDPALRQAAQAVALRAAIELARLESHAS
jgi:hypothetical protein